MTQIPYLLIIGAPAVLWITHAGACCGLRERCSLWISQPCGLGRIYPHLTVLWITGLSALWITMLRICGLERGEEEMWGLASPHALRQD